MPPALPVARPAFSAWYALASRPALPAAPETLAEHLATILDRASLAKRLATIGQYHRLANQPFSTTHLVIHHTLRGIHRKHGRPALAEIKRLLTACRRLLDYAGALRRAELVAVERQHISFSPRGPPDADPAQQDRRRRVVSCLRIDILLVSVRNATELSQERARLRC